MHRPIAGLRADALALTGICIPSLVQPHRLPGVLVFNLNGRAAHAATASTWPARCRAIREKAAVGRPHTTTAAGGGCSPARSLKVKSKFLQPAYGAGSTAGAAGSLSLGARGRKRASGGGGPSSPCPRARTAAAAATAAAAGSPGQAHPQRAHGTCEGVLRPGAHVACEGVRLRNARCCGVGPHPATARIEVSVLQLLLLLLLLPPL
jgi:hypothetical protein